jgi:hypothetical protein
VAMQCSAVQCSGLKCNAVVDKALAGYTL